MLRLLQHAYDPVFPDMITQILPNFHHDINFVIILETHFLIWYNWDKPCRIRKWTDSWDPLISGYNYNFIATSLLCFCLCSISTALSLFSTHHDASLLDAFNVRTRFMIPANLPWWYFIRLLEIAWIELVCPWVIIYINGWIPTCLEG